MRRWLGLGGEWPKSTSSLLFKMEIFLSEIGSLEPGGNAVWWPGIKISEQPQAYLFPISLHFAPSIARFRKKNAKSGSTPLITVSTKNVWINFVSRMQYQISLSIARGLSTYPDIFNCLMLVEDHADRGLHTNYDNFTTRNNARAVKFAQYKGSTKKKFRT